MTDVDLGRSPQQPAVESTQIRREIDYSQRSGERARLLGSRGVLLAPARPQRPPPTSRALPCFPPNRHGDPMALDMSPRLATSTLSRPRPSVGVVVVASNAAAFIDQALAGVAGQSCRPDQVLVVDNASTDTTAALARAWSNQLPVTVLRLAHRVGRDEARHQAIQRTDTDLLAALDTHDVWLPDHLEHLVDVWWDQPGVVSARAEVWKPGHRGLDYHKALGLRFPKQNQLAAMLSGHFVFFGSLFSRADYRQAVDCQQAGHRPTGGFGSAGRQDWELWVKLVANQVPILLADFPTVLHRLECPGGNRNGPSHPASPFDQALISRVNEFRIQHPEWLADAEWDEVLRFRRAMVHLDQALGGLAKRDPRSIVQLARAVGHGGAPMLAHITRLISYRALSAYSR